MYGKADIERLSLRLGRDHDWTRFQQKVRISFSDKRFDLCSSSASFGPLLANRFLLGMFEAVNIPLFSELIVRLSDFVDDSVLAIISMTWYRRREQPIRIALWYGTKCVVLVSSTCIRN